MKKLFALTFILFSYLTKADFWTQKANYPGAGLDAPFSFFVGNKGYVGCGQDGANTVHKDFWEYDPSTNTWTQKADFGGLPRWFGSGFSIGNKGYAGLGGTAGNTTFYNDFWEYDPATNLWTQKASFGGSPRFVAVGFSIGNFGYMGTGLGLAFFNDLWQYNPATNAWIQEANMPLPGIGDANSFVIGINAYILGTCYTTDNWEYNSVTNTWTQTASLPSTPRCDAAAFTICEKGYWGTGEFGNSSYGNDLWQYNAASNSWIQKGNFLGQNRDEPFCFAIGTKGYIGGGGEDGFATSTLFNDFWEYTPDSACATGIEEFPVSNLEFSIFPNPAKDYIVISYPLTGKENIYITITDVAGKKVYETKLLTSDFRLPTSNFQKGIYFVELTNGKQKAVKKFVRE